MKPYLFFKRSFDLAASLIALLILIIPCAVIALLIKITSRGSVIFKQERLGKNGAVFFIWKFRTMVQNADRIGDGIFIKNADDVRITKLGRFLRKTSIDELPQLINIIRGDMSLVGPRPPLIDHPYHYHEYTNLTRRRFDMRPGITGLAQIQVRNSVSWDERITFDVEYINTCSFFFDLKILFLTVGKVIRRDNVFIPEVIVTEAMEKAVTVQQTVEK